MRICDICKKNSMTITTWTPGNSTAELCYKCYKLWINYQNKAIKEAYKKFIKEVEKENDK